MVNQIGLSEIDYFHQNQYYHYSIAVFCVQPQVVLLLTNEDRVSKKLSDNMAERTGCEVKQLGAEPLDDIKKWMEEQGLDWKVVAFMGK